MPTHASGIQVPPSSYHHYTICRTRPPQKAHGPCPTGNLFLVDRIHASSDDSDQAVCYNGDRRSRLGAFKGTRLPNALILTNQPHWFLPRKPAHWRIEGEGRTAKRRSERTDATQLHPSRPNRSQITHPQPSRGPEPIKQNAQPNVPVKGGDLVGQGAPPIARAPTPGQSTAQSRCRSEDQTRQIKRRSKRC